MTVEERIAALEARLAQAEARLAIVEARPLPVATQWGVGNRSGWTCHLCHAWVPSGTAHSCGGSVA